MVGLLLKDKDFVARGGHGHYAKGIHVVADAYGLNGLHPTEEQMNKGIQGVWELCNSFSTKYT